MGILDDFYGKAGLTKNYNKSFIQASTNIFKQDVKSPASKMNITYID